MKFIFWFSLGFIFYTYVGYPCLLLIWAKFSEKKINKNYINPFVSIIVAVHNEEKNIKARIENLLNQDYPKDKLEIIVVSDGSTDATNDLITQLRNDPMTQLPSNQITLLSYFPRHGKPYALNLGVKEAKGEIIVFTDARQRFEANAIKELTANFHDSSVGCVSGELFFYENTKSSIKHEMGLYWNYEKQIRKLESKINSVAGATGAIYAIRKNLYKPIPSDILLDDVLIPMQVVLQGFRTIFDSTAKAYDWVSKDIKQEKRRKIRTLLGNWQLITKYPILLLPFKNPIWWQFISHKITRLFVPFFLILLFLTAFALKGLFYQLTWLTMLSIFLFSFLERPLNNYSILFKLSKLARTFLMLNYFAFLSFFYFISGKKNIW